ncbi:hypothetical protein ACE1CD_11185 [Aerosakkonema sp. BLCC-F183]|uniref:hypothetical protein n=1 Tax=Aerosakkonema sp. BLCC-F183 TaxID=3342834 RepID=UPI0035BB94F4
MSANPSSSNNNSGGNKLTKLGKLIGGLTALVVFVKGGIEIVADSTQIYDYCNKTDWCKRLWPEPPLCPVILPPGQRCDR